MEINYENIKPLLKDEVWEQNMVKCTFQVDGRDPIQAIGTVPFNQNDVMKQAVKSSVKSSVISSIFRGIGRGIGSLFGGVGGAVASTTVSSVGYGVASATSYGSMQPKLTAENKKEAVVNAFKTVSNFFKYDEASHQWVSAF